MLNPKPVLPCEPVKPFIPADPVKPVSPFDPVNPTIPWLANSTHWSEFPSLYQKYWIPESSSIQISPYCWPEGGVAEVVTVKFPSDPV